MSGIASTADGGRQTAESSHARSMCGAAGCRGVVALGALRAVCAQDGAAETRGWKQRTVRQRKLKLDGSMQCSDAATTSIESCMYGWVKAMHLTNPRSSRKWQRMHPSLPTAPRREEHVLLRPQGIVIVVVIILHISRQPSPLTRPSTLLLIANQSLRRSANSTTSSTVNTPRYRSASAMMPLISSISVSVLASKR